MNHRSIPSHSEVGALAFALAASAAVTTTTVVSAFLTELPLQTIAAGAASAAALSFCIARYIANGNLNKSNQRADEVMELWLMRLDRFVKYGEPHDARLLTPLAVVTGSNSGVGMSSAENLLLCGWRVVLACRNLKAAEEARREIVRSAQVRLAARYANLSDPAQKTRATQLSATLATNAVVTPLDVSNLQSIRSFVKELVNIEGQAGADSEAVEGLATYHDGLRLLMNNAGIFQLNYGQSSSEGIEEMLNTNYAGPAYLTHLVFQDIVKPRIDGGNQTPYRVVDLASAVQANAFVGFTNQQITEALAAMADRTQTLENNSLLKKQAETYSVSKFLMLAHAQNIKLDAERAGWDKDGLVTAFSLHPGLVRTEVFKRSPSALKALFSVFSQFAAKNLRNGASNQTYLSLILLEEQATKDPLTKSVLDNAKKALKVADHLGDSPIVKASSASGKYFIDIGEAKGAGQISAHANPEVFKIVAEWTDKIIARFEAVQ